MAQHDLMQGNTNTHLQKSGVTLQIHKSQQEKNQHVEDSGALFGCLRDITECCAPFAELVRLCHATTLVPKNDIIAVAQNACKVPIRGCP